MSASVARRNGQAHDATTKTAALMELALAGGSATRAARRLKERGTPVPKRTLELWRGTAEYAEVRDHQALEVQKEIAREHEDLAIQAAGVTRRLLSRLDKEADDLPLRDVPGAARNTGTIAGISTDKQMLTRERPLPTRAPDRDIQEIFRALKAISPNLVVGDDEPPRALDLPDVEVIEDTAATDAPGQDT